MKTAAIMLLVELYGGVVFDGQKQSQAMADEIVTQQARLNGPRAGPVAGREEIASLRAELRERVSCCPRAR